MKRSLKREKWKNITDHIAKETYFNLIINEVLIVCIYIFLIFWKLKKINNTDNNNFV